MPSTMVETLGSVAEPKAALPTPRMRRPAPDDDWAGENESEGAMA